MFSVQATIGFTDILDNKKRVRDEIFTVNSLARLRELLGQNKKKQAFVKLIKANKRASNKREGKKIIIFQNFVYKIGGIETFIINLTKKYRDRDIQLVVQNIGIEKAIEMSEFCDVIIDNKKDLFNCDILLLGNYNSAEYIIPRTKAKKIYQLIHADFHGLKESIQWKDFNWNPDRRVDKVITVSKAAQVGLEKAFNIKSEVIYNILDEDFEKEPIKFITLSRATHEKGIHRILALAKLFKENGRDFIWFLCCPTEQIDPQIKRSLEEIPEIVIIPASRLNKGLIKNCDYLMQLSDTESFCYSAYEALQKGVPCILTDYPEAYETIVDGESGYIISRDITQYNNELVTKIFENIPTEISYVDKCDVSLWERVFDGTF